MTSSSRRRNSISDPVEQLAIEGEALAAAAARDLSAPVPTCPAWTVSDLIEHVGQVHNWVIRCLDSSPEDVVRLADEPPAPTQHRIEWYRQVHEELTRRLAGDHPERIAAGPRGPVSVAWWRRRQGHEVSIHRWDAQHAVGGAAKISRGWAIDGIDEYCEVVLPFVRLPHEGQSSTSIRLQTGEIGPAWELRFAEGGVVGARCDDGDGDGVVIEGGASDLLLWVWGRPRRVRSAGSAASPATLSLLQQRLRY